MAQIEETNAGAYYLERKKHAKNIGNLTREEWVELCDLDYSLTWYYTDDYQRDLNRYKELTNKR